jgi:hypothetical protein
MKLYLQPSAPLSSKAISARSCCFCRLMTTILSLGCIFGLSSAVYTASSSSFFIALDDIFNPPRSSGRAAQIVVQEQHYRFNSEAYNREREKEIARDSRKLLSLIIEVKSEVDRTPDRNPSPDTVRKMNQIEKLAHSVKEKMTISPGTK